VVFSLVAAPLKKTAIYIDGYNLYYSRLRGTAFKWLHIVALFRDRILQVQDPSAQVTRQIFHRSHQGQLRAAWPGVGARASAIPPSTDSEIS
jgi:hypothetical protein